MAKILITNVLAIFVAICLFDAVVYWFLPASFALRYTEYRVNPPPEELGVLGMYPKDYFVEHPTRGFDIGKNKTGLHWVDGVTYPIWSNSLGCFDNEHHNYEQYIYLAGDSVTWGYSPFSQKFGTLIEGISGAQVIKCGVTHTGQRHQFEKFLSIIETIGALPKTIFVIYVANDVANDYAHPHTTVIDGWKIDNIYLDSDNHLIRHDQEKLRKKIEDRLRAINLERNKQSEWAGQVKIFLKTYSFTANLLNELTDKVADSIRQSEKSTVAEAFVDKTSQSRIYTLPRDKNGIYWYSNNPYAQFNKNAITNFSSFSRLNKVELIVVLFPPRHKYNDANWYREVRGFLTDNDIKHLDLALEFKTRKVSADEIYWAHDGHPSPSGNSIISKILLEKYPNAF